MQMATRQNVNTVGHELQSSKSAIRAAEVFHPMTNERLILVDTPGLDDTKLDLELLKIMAAWLQKNHRNCRVAGVVYMHRISDNRCTGSPQNNKMLFDILCQNDSKKNVVIATTMWKRVNENVAAGREEELGKKRWREMLLEGMRIMRFHDSFTSAWEIIDNVLKSRNTSAASPAPRIEMDLAHSQLKFDDIERGIDQLQKIKNSNRNHSSMRLRSNPSMDNLPENKRTPHVPEISYATISNAYPKLLSGVGNGHKRRGPHGGTGEYFTRTAFGRERAVVVPTKMEDLSKDQVVIALMGLTGAGKSSFIGMATGYEDGIGHQLQSYTHDVNLIKFKCHERNNVNLVFVDTPALDHTHKSYSDVLEIIAQWLKKLRERKILLAGVLYFHRISDPPNRNMASDLAVFEVLCRKQSLKNVIFVTTMWDQVDEDKGWRVEKELKEKYFKGMINQGARIMRYDGTADTTWDIIGKLYARC